MNDFNENIDTSHKTLIPIKFSFQQLFILGVLTFLHVNRSQNQNNDFGNQNNTLKF